MSDGGQANPENKGFPPLIDGEELLGHQPCAALVGKKVHRRKTHSESHPQTNSPTRKSLLQNAPLLALRYPRSRKDSAGEENAPLLHAIALAREAGTISIPAVVDLEDTVVIKGAGVCKL